MQPAFTDTSFYLALLNTRDAWHAKALDLSARLLCPVVTSQWILVELGGALNRGTNRSLFVRLLAGLQSDPDTTIVPASTALFERGLNLFSNRADKEWSLTDCISFIIMHDQTLTDALTTDHHFEQAGFNVLLK